MESWFALDSSELKAVHVAVRALVAVGKEKGLVSRLNTLRINCSFSIRASRVPWMISVWFMSSSVGPAVIVVRMD